MFDSPATHASDSSGTLCRRPVAWCLVIAACLVAVLLGASSLCAAAGLTVYRPQGNRVPKSGLRMKVDLNWVSGQGYRPVRIELSSVTGPVTADRTLRFEISPNDWSGFDGDFYASRDIEIPEGQPGADVTLSIPQNETWHVVSFRVFEDGKQIEELSAQGVGIEDGNEWTEAMPKALFIHHDAPTPEQRRSLRRQVRLRQLTEQSALEMDDLPDLRTWRDVTMAEASRPTPPPEDLSVIERLELIDENMWFELLPPGYLTENWIDLTSFDLILLSRDDLRLMKERYPPQFNALRTVIGTGSILCVWGAGDDFERLGELEQLLELPPVSDDADNERFRGWSVPDKGKFAKGSSSLWKIVQNQGYVLGEELVETESGVWELLPDGRRVLREQPSPQPVTDHPPFVQRKMDLGTVVAIASNDPFPGNTAFWYWMLNSLDENDWQTYRRYGMSLHRPNYEYPNLLIPGVGAAPVVAFRVLITLFVIVIGPVNYWLLHRWRRLHLLLVTVPAGALLVTATLFLYAVLSDGLGVRARLRSFTLLDQTRGRCISWSRQSYYAGLAPSEGLVFPRGCTVYPVYQYPEMEDEQGHRVRRVEWDDQQRLTTGWLPSRVTTQMLVVHADDTQIGLKVRPADSGETSPEITNALGSRILKLVLRDEGGRYYSAADVADGAIFRPAQTDQTSAQAALRMNYDVNQLEFPHGFDSRGYGYPGRYGRRQYYDYYGVDRQLPVPSFRSSVLERNLMIAGCSEVDLDKRSYVAVVERTSAVPIGTESNEEASYHVVKGRW